LFISCIISKGSALTDVPMRFGNRLREVRKGKGLSQERLAEIADLHRTYINDIEQGRRNVTIATVESLARALGVLMAELMPDWVGRPGE
jgi:transcriptional regulator with XRE-family HTH domain